MAQREFTQHFPQPGWVEHDASEIWQTQPTVLREALQRAGISAQQVLTPGTSTPVRWKMC